MNHYVNLKSASRIHISGGRAGDEFETSIYHLIGVIEKAIEDAEDTADRLSDALVQTERGGGSKFIKCDWIEYVLDEIKSEIDDFFPSLKREWRRVEKHLKEAHDVASRLGLIGNRRGGRFLDILDDREVIAELLNRVEESIGPLRALKGDAVLER